jgi:hypothetical protein
MLVETIYTAPVLSLMNKLLIFVLLISVVVLACSMFLLIVH